MDLTQGSVSRLFLKYLIPSVFVMIGLSLYIVIDAIFIGQGVGVDGLIALNISLPVFTMFLCLGNLLNMGGSTAFSISLGKKELRQAQELFSITFYSGIILGALFTFFSLLYIDELCYALGASESVFKLVKEYNVILIWFSTFFIINSVLMGFIRNDHAPKLAMVAGVVSNLLNIILDAIFIFVFHWGIVGGNISYCHQSSCIHFNSTMTIFSIKITD